MSARPQSAVRYFMEWAGISWKPPEETQAQGRYRGARRLAAAERWARNAGLTFEWALDGYTSAEWTDEAPPWPTWECIARDASGRVVASLMGIDFGRDGSPWGDPYRRVVEAELAAEAKSCN